jgi:acylphosphatase
MSEARARAVFRGRVQGVFFRAETRDRARSLGLSGWVRNVPDGSVEAVFEGERERIESILDWCRRGPGLAEVEDVDVDWEQPRGEEGFGAR